MRSETSVDTLNSVSLFVGGGGMHLGLEQAGFACLLATDIEASSAKTFRLNRPNTPFLHSDIRHVTQEQIEGIVRGRHVHLVSGGPPCQGFSTLGDQNIADPRNALFWSFLKVVRWISPDCFLMENVNYLRTQYNGRYEKEIVEAFSQIGYRVHVNTLNAADYGVPQIRKRVFFFGTRLDGDFDWPAPTHGIPGREYATVGEALAGLPDPLHGDGVANHDALRHSDTVIARYKLIPEGGRMPPPQELPEEIRRRNFGNTYKRLHRGKPSLTLVPGNNAFPVHPVAHRSLTPREAARIQTFPDEYVFAGSRAEQCKLVGNAVPATLAMHLGLAAKKHITNSQSRSALAEKKHIMTDYRPMPDSSGPTAISFFSGAGGMTLGFVNSGFNVVSSYDKKTIVAKNAELNFPDIPHFHTDINELDVDAVRQNAGVDKVDVVFGGPPCQGFSIFGKRRFVNTKGHRPETDERNELSIKYIDLAIGLDPRVILMENVKGFVSTPRNESSYLDVVTDKLRSAGYVVEWKVVNCADYGVPQLRERFLLVAWKNGLQFLWPEPKFHKEPKAWQRRHVTVGDVITDLMDPATEGAEFSHMPMAHKELVVERYKLIPEGGRLPEGTLPEELKKGYRTDVVKNFSHVYKRLSMDAPATTMVPGHNAFPIHPRLHRALTVREAARIQTFPDYMRFIGTRQQQCTLVGNAVPPLLAELFGNQIMKTIRGNFVDPGYKKDIYELKVTA